MTCPSYDILSQLIDGELSDSDMAEVRAHVQGCLECAELVRAIQEIGNEVRGAPLPQASNAVLARLSRGARRIPDRAVRRVATFMTAAASIVLLVSVMNVTTTPVQATATSSLADWEKAAIAPEDESATREQATARWIAADLSRQAIVTEETP